MRTPRRLCAAPYLVCLIMLCGTAATTVTRGQSGRPAAAKTTARGETDEVIRVRADEVLLPVSVRDGRGRPVEGLTAENFLIYDNGVRQQITSFNLRRAPVNVVLLLDASTSVFRQMRLIRTAAKNFLRSLGAADQVCIMQFADSVELLQDWTPATGLTELEKALDWRYRPGARTTLYDGLYLAAEEPLRRVAGRRIVILLTDGIDTAHTRGASWEDALSALRRVETSVYVVSLTASLRAALKERTGGGRLTQLLTPGIDRRLIAQYLATLDGAEARLEKLAVQTGGRLFLPVEKDELSPAYEAIAEELRTQYVITYQPRPQTQTGEWRRIRVLVTPGGYEIAARAGYTGRS